MANRPFELPETRGSFQLQGTVTGMERDTAFKEILTRTKKQMRMSRFGVSTSKDNQVYVDLNGMERDLVYFSKRNSEGKNETKKVPWSNRHTFNEEGFRLIGTNIGIEQFIDDKGKKQNKQKRLAEFDACEYIAENLKDDTDVFVRGKLEFSSYTNKNDEISRMTKFIPSQISALKSPINFEDENYVEKSDFTQTIVFMGASLDDTDPEDKKGLVQAKIVAYNTIEDTEFVVRNQKLFNMFKKNLKPYTSIQVHGAIINKALATEVEEDSGWGESNPMDATNKIYIRELEIRGASPDTIDTDTYTKEKMEEAIRAINDFGGVKESTTTSADDWGTDAPASEDGWGDEEW